MNQDFVDFLNKFIKGGVAEGEHHPLGFSGASRWLNCSLAPHLEFGMPDSENEHSLAGTVAHEMAETILLVSPDNYDDHIQHHQELALYIEHVKALGGELQVEVRMDLSVMVPGGYGTADALVWNPATKTLIVVDLKWGMGQVFAQDNPQGLGYLVGARELYPDAEHFEFHIVQPRLDWIDVATYTGESLDVYVKRVKSAVDAIMHEPKATPGQTQCQWCKAAATCEARYEEMRSVFLDDDEKITDPDTLDDDELARIVALLPDLKSWIKAVEAKALSTAMDNGLEGYRVVEGRSLRRWKDERAMLDTLKGLGYSDSDLVEQTPISVAAAEKLVGKKRFADIANELVEKPKGKPTLVIATDKRRDFEPENPFES